MVNIFQYVLEMSIYGSIAIIAVLILRKLFHNLPKRITCLFWLIPGLRLLCPLNLNTIFSVMNIAKLSDNVDRTINKTANAVTMAGTVRPDPSQMKMNLKVASTGGLPTDPKTIMTIIWIIGMTAIMIYVIVKTVRLMDVLKSAKKVRSRDYYVSDAIDTSFVLGVVRPRIYMQAGLSEREESYILQHERTHINNLDHVTRIVGVIVVCIHWFNPLVWVAFVKMCADLEMRCDEAVIDRMGEFIKKEYCRSIVRHALKRGTADRGVYAAFVGDNYNGREIGMRIKNLIGYKKVSKIVAVSVIAFTLVLTVALSTKAQNSNTEDTEPENMQQTAETDRQEPILLLDHEVAGPVSVPGNILTDMTEEENLANYGKEELVLPDDVEYSDEGRPYSKTYDYRDTPVLNRIGAIMEKEGFEILDPDMEYLDKEGNVQTGRELYVVNAYKEDPEYNMLVNFYMVSEEYARDSYNEIVEENGHWVYHDTWQMEDETVHNYRIYDPKTGVMMDATGNYDWDWESLGLF